MKAKKCCTPSNGSHWFFTAAVVLGLLAGYFNIPAVMGVASIISQIFMNLLKLVSLPIIFLSIVSTASGMESVEEIKHLGRKVVKYTLLTTVIAASIALLLFVLINPVISHVSSSQSFVPGTSGTYMGYLLQVIPSNIVQPFSENNVIGVLFLAIALSLSMLALPVSNRSVLHGVFSSLFAAIMKMTTFIVGLMPIAVWAFITLFCRDLRQGLEIKSLALYLVAVLAANVIQALVVLPLLLKFKGISPVQMGKAMLPALTVAFFSKSSSAAMPMAMKCAEERAGISRKTASFAFPLCTTINMNACAAFILITVLFVSMSNGVTYSGMEMVMWIVLATIAAVGNAGVPMGCYFLSSAFLAAMNVPLNILGVILPFYSLIDMLESAINVWSDSCVVSVVDKELVQAKVSFSKPKDSELLGQEAFTHV